jgi:hypothetical protein
VWVGERGYSQKEGWQEAHDFNAFFTDARDMQFGLHRSEDATRFTGEVQGGLTVTTFEDGDDDITQKEHQFAVVIDSVWQTDPISGSHNFVSKTLENCGN